MRSRPGARTLRHRQLAVSLDATLKPDSETRDAPGRAVLWGAGVRSRGGQRGGGWGTRLHRDGGPCLSPHEGTFHSTSAQKQGGTRRVCSGRLCNVSSPGTSPADRWPLPERLFVPVLSPLHPPSWEPPAGICGVCREHGRWGLRDRASRGAGDPTRLRMKRAPPSHHVCLCPCHIKPIQNGLAASCRWRSPWPPCPLRSVVTALLPRSSRAYSPERNPKQSARAHPPPTLTTQGPRSYEPPDGAPSWGPMPGAPSQGHDRWGRSWGPQATFPAEGGPACTPASRHSSPVARAHVSPHGQGTATPSGTFLGADCARDRPGADVLLRVPRGGDTSAGTAVRDLSVVQAGAAGPPAARSELTRQPHVADPAPSDRHTPRPPARRPALVSVAPEAEEPGSVLPAERGRYWSAQCPRRPPAARRLWAPRTPGHLCPAERGELHPTFAAVRFQSRWPVSAWSEGDTRRDGTLRSRRHPRGGTRRSKGRSQGHAAACSASHRGSQFIRTNSW